jgi:peroxiredoxin
MKLSRPVTIAAIALAVAAGAGFAWRSLDAREPAPEVSYTLLDGSQRSTAQLRGKVVLVNFWATSCTTCMHEMPQIVSTYEKFKGRGYETLAVAMSYDPPEFVAGYAQSRRLPFSVAFDKSGAIAQRFGNVQLTPTSVLINKRGEIVKRYVGEPDFAALQQLVEQLLAEA